MAAAIMAARANQERQEKEIRDLQECMLAANCHWCKQRFPAQDYRVILDGSHPYKSCYHCFDNFVERYGPANPENYWGIMSYYWPIGTKPLPIKPKLVDGDIEFQWYNNVIHL